MSAKKRTHLRGERGQAFANRIRGIPPEQVLCVSLDISKYFHTGMIHNGMGEIVTPLFEIDIFKSGLEKLCRLMAAAVARTQAQVVLLGMEPTGHYFENLARHLLAGSQPVTLINSLSTRLNREQQLMRHEKSDEIDTAAIGDLLRRGEGSPYQPAQGVYLQLQHIDRVRVSKVKIQTMLKNQILGHLDRIFPGLVLKGKAALQRYTPLFQVDFWRCETLQHLIRVCPNPHHLIGMPPQELVEAFHARQYRLGLQTAAKIIAYAQHILLPDPELVEIRGQLLQVDLALLDEVERQLAKMESQLQALLAQTPYRVWVRLKGLSPLQVASLAAAIGDPQHYACAAKVFRRSGLVSGRKDSGVRQRKGKGKHVIKAGDVYLRRALMNSEDTLVLHQPLLRQYYHTLKQTKPEGVARVATARRAMGLLWAFLRDGYSHSLLLQEETM